MNEILSNFSRWVHWKERSTLKSLSLQGVYVLKNFEQNDSITITSLKEPMLYIGETCDSFRTRFNRFQISATTGKGKHSGGRNFNEIYDLDKIPDWLYVAIFPVNIKQPKDSAYIQYIERYLIWEYVCLHNALPICNKK